MLNALNIKKIIYGTLSVFVVLYFLSAVFAPVDPETLAKYNIDEIQLRLLSASILVPLVAIWGCAAYGFVHFKLYALSIKGSERGKGSNTLANGLGIIAAQLLISGGFNSLSSIEAVKSALGGDKGVMIISTALSLSISLFAAFVLYKATKQLNDSIDSHTKPKLVTKHFYLLGVVSIAFLIAIVLSYPVSGSSESVYKYIPVGMAIVFVWLPSIIIWNLYLMAVKGLYYYRKHVSGEVYRSSLGLLTTGIFVILGSSVLVQIFGTVGELSASLSLGAILVIVYILIAAIGVGYLYIANAATKLSKVEN